MLLVLKDLVLDWLASSLGSFAALHGSPSGLVIDFSCGGPFHLVRIEMMNGWNGTSLRPIFRRACLEDPNSFCLLNLCPNNEWKNVPRSSIVFNITVLGREVLRCFFQICSVGLPSHSALKRRVIAF